MLALEFPPINEVIRWQDIFPTFNKVALIACLAVADRHRRSTSLAARRDPMVAPTGVRNLAETGVEFIEDQIVMQTMGNDGLGWTPFLLTLFIFVYLCNLPGRHPDPAVAGHGAHGDPAVPRPHRVGHLQRRRLQAQRPQVPHRHALAAERAGRRCARSSG